MVANKDVNVPEYSANDMEELDDKTHLRKRPALTLGEETGDSSYPFSSMQRTCVREVYENSVDEGLQGYADRLAVTFFADHSFEVQDNGRGIPTDINKKTGKSGIVQAIGTLRSGRNFDSKSTKKSTGTNGLGAAAVAVFSKRYDVTVYRNNKKYQLSFQGGVPGFFAEDDNPDSKFTPLGKDLSVMNVSADDRDAETKKLWKTGTRTKVWLDPSAFPTSYWYDEQEIIERLKGSAFLVPELTISIVNELNMVDNPQTHTKEPQTETFHFPDGVPEMVDHITVGNKLTHTIAFSGEQRFMNRNVPVLQADGSVKNEDIERVVPYEVALAWNTTYEPVVKSYVNTVNTQSHGVHVSAFMKAMQTVFNDKFQDMRGVIKKNDELPTIPDFEEGLSLIVSVFLNEPNFTGQSKTQLSGQDVRKALVEAFTNDLQAWVESKSNAKDVAVIAQKVVTASRNRQQARRQRDLKRQKNEISSSSLPVKLNDCAKAGSDVAELYICEGDSALSALKAARDGEINALLPLRGKIINPLKASESKVLANQEVQDIATTMGAGIGNNFDIEKMRYGKVFIAVDADHDGKHIATLVFLLFYTYFRPVVEENRLFMLQTPLFSINVEGKNQRRIYASDDESRDAAVAQLKKTKEHYTITRLKGLGEVDAEILAETAIAPETRVVERIMLDNPEATTQTLQKLLGGDAEGRREWFEKSYSESVASALD